LIVVDTTVWIDFLESRETDFDVHLKELIEREEPLALTDIIYCEILQGIADDGKFRRTREILLTYPIFKTRGLRTFEHAAQIYRDCRKQGLTIRKTVDCIIAATCIEAGVQLYHNDRDFAAIAKVKRLKIYHAT
jgi:predicted nucleic acid-binding protein